MYRRFHLGDLPAMAALTVSAFNTKHDDAVEWFRRAGHDNLRVVEASGTVQGMLLDIPMGLFLGGQRVSLHGVAGVSVDPIHRSQGVGRRMMEAYLTELCRAGVALSALFASVRPLYDAVGYGIAGRSFISEVPTDAFRSAGARATGWRRGTKADRPAVEAFYRQQAEAGACSLDRGPYLWDRVLDNQHYTHELFLWEPEGALRAYVVVRQSSDKDGWTCLNLVDHLVLDAEALAAVMGFVGGFSAIARKVEVKGPLVEPLVDALPQHVVQQRLYEPWLLRVVDVQRALMQRGWSPTARGELVFSVDDPVLPDNSGTWRLRVADGKAEVERAARGGAQLAMGPTALAGLYTGDATPRQLALRGGLTVLDPHGERVAEALFAGPSPQLRDLF